MAAGTASPSLTSSVLAEMQSQGKVMEQDESDINGAAGVLYAAGTETFLFSKKAQEEMDRVIGCGCLPELDDRAWGCPAPLGLVHRLMSDDEYRGYDIDEGSTVLPNI
ncbi:uncharacterized protein LAESUDRAFT_723997 [Laetiporus sulphureus 93-53]